jgi:xanthine dehydrogenase accessory factor
VRDILGSLRSWYGAGRTLGLATVVGTSKSAPRQPGAAMAVSADGDVVGSVSGGCVEGAVYDLATEVIEGGTPVLQTYGYSDADAFAVGLTCGGSVTVFVQAVDAERLPVLGEVLASVDAGRPVALATVIDGGKLGGRLAVWPDRAAGTLGASGLDAAVTDDARGMLAHGTTGQRHYGPNGERRRDEVTVFVEAFAPPPRMLVFGAIDFAAAVARIGKFLGYRVTVCDARAVFATAKRFPEADEVVVEWPDQYLSRTEVDSRTVICVLTHDPKFDVPLLEVALRTPAGYVGAMGSRSTHADRMARLRERGLTEPELERLRAPIGLDLGARTPEETAVAIAAEIVADRWGGSGRPLGDMRGAIHQSPAGSAGTTAADLDVMPADTRATRRTTSRSAKAGGG